MLRRSFCAIIVSTAVILFVSSAAYCHEHIFVGADNNQLLIYGVPSVIELLPTGDYLGDKQIYTAELDCWHSAEEEYRLDNNSKETTPGWLIVLKRISYSDPANFWMEDESTTLEILTSDGSTYAFDAPMWDDQEGWYFHNHTNFCVLASGAGETFNAVFSVLDTGITGYLESAPCTFTFITIPEPTTLVLLGAGLISVSRIRRK